MNQIFSRKSLDLLGRVFLVCIFVNAVPAKVTSFSAVVDAIVERGFPEPIAAILLVAAIICLTLGSFLFVFSKDQTRGAIFLLTFLIPTTIIFHFSPFQTNQVLLNAGLIGGLLISLTRPKFVK